MKLVVSESRKKGVIKHLHNPFIGVGFKISTRKKRMVIGDSHLLIEKVTGEEKDIGHLVTYKMVDDEEFVKVYTSNIALTFDLTSSGNKVFHLLLRVMQQNSMGKDAVYLSLATIDRVCETLKVKVSKGTFYRGLKELIGKQILAESVEANIYFINPHIVFNGDRIAFTRAYQRKVAQTAIDNRDPKTIDMFQEGDTQ